MPKTVDFNTKNIKIIEHHFRNKFFIKKLLITKHLKMFEETKHEHYASSAFIGFKIE